MTATATTADIAAALDTTPRTLRKFLRSDACKIEGVGKGARYSLPTGKREVASLRKAFLAWGDAEVAKKAAKVEAKVTTSDAPEVDFDEVLDIADEVLEGEEPTAADLLDIEAGL